MLGRLLGKRYRLLRVVGEGGMGTVYEAEHVELSKRVALKLMHPRMDAGEQARQRFEREARAAAATGHENVVDVFDLGRDVRGAPFLVMELLTGLDLGRVIHRAGRLPAARTVWIVGQVLRALEAVHAVGIHHRDLKPDNVFLTRRAGFSDWVKVLDFGVAEMVAEREPASGRRKVAAGTLHYMAPEQASGAPNQDARVDVYAAGVLLYECLTGELPFEATSATALRTAIQNTRPKSVADLAPETDQALVRVVEHAMAKRPEGRPATARALYDLLVPFGAGRPPSVPVLTPPMGVQRPSARRSFDHATNVTMPAVAVEVPPETRGASAQLGFAPRPQNMASKPHAFHASSEAKVAERAAGADLPEATPLTSGARRTEAPVPVGLPRLRGSWVSEIASDLSNQLGRSAYTHMIDGLPSEAGAIFRGVLLPAAWVDVSVLEALLAAAPSHLPCRGLGRDATVRALRRWGEPQSRRADLAAPELPTWAQPLYELTAGLRVQLLPSTGGRMKLCVDIVPPPSAAVAGALAGLLEALADTAKVEVSRAASAHDGSRGSTASLSFRPR